MLSWRIVFSLFVGLLLAKTAFAQTFNASPSALCSKEVAFEQANECFIYFDNPSGDTLQLHWRLIDSNAPVSWDIDLCDYGSCYIGIPSNGLMNPVQDTIRPYIKLIVQPDTNPGAAWIWFRVYEEGNQGNFVDVFYSLFTPGTLASNSPEQEPLLAFPNPANEVLTLHNPQENFASAIVRDLNGKVIWQGSLPPKTNQTLSTAYWPAGFYLLQHGNQSQKLIVSH